MAKLWDKGFSVNEKIDRFTVGKDRELDLLLAPYDIRGTIAHITMLESVGLLKKEELEILAAELENILKKTEDGSFRISDDIEDVHSQVELMLTDKLGELGKKVHTGRSRNDQVLLDIKLFTRAEIKKTARKVKALFDALIEASEKYRNVLMPGYTHLQVAMPSSFGLWFGAYAETLSDDLQMLSAALRIADRNPLGSAAGYGSSAPLDRQKTTELMEFESMVFNSIAAQMGRGKLERETAFALSCIAETLGRLAADCCLFNSQNFGFISLPDELTTGSSIMPHKKNPDVFELIRAHCNKICGVPETIKLITSNLPSGYYRDMQILKEAYLPVFGELDDCLDIALFAISNMSVKEGLMDDPKYRAAFSVEEVNRLTAEGMPFRDAYKKVGKDILNGVFEFKGELHHTHEGSIGNLCNDRITERMNAVIQDIFPEGF